MEPFAEDPLAQLGRWMEEAKHLPESTAMALATASPEGVPSCRMVLLKAIDEEGILFFTNYRSRKGQELTANPYCSCTLYWQALDRQVNFDGRAVQVSRERSARYFARRPRGSQLGAWASSHQGSAIPSHEALRSRLTEVEKRFEGEEVSVPPYWGGFRIVSYRVEFWHGRESRLHERFSYRRERGGWEIERLSP